jgi:hypothetical protein
MRHALLAAALLCAAASAAAQEAVEEKNVASGKVKLDPAKGYILLQSPDRTFGTFLRVPDAATTEEWEKDRQEAFEKAQKKYPGQLKRWESDVSIAKQTKGKVPDKPAEPTLETRPMGSIFLRDMVSFGPMFVFSKSETQFTYLNQVKPGTYIYYGPVMVGPAVPAAGLCFCMGTVQFEVKAGEITDLGNSLIALGKREPPYDVSTQMAMEQEVERRAKGKEVRAWPPPLAHGVPESLKALPAREAELQASGKLNNFFGITITRMAPIPGVLGYRRDTVLDLRNGKDVESPSITTQVRIKK